MNPYLLRMLETRLVDLSRQLGDGEGEVALALSKEEIDQLLFLTGWVLDRKSAPEQQRTAP